MALTPEQIAQAQAFRERNSTLLRSGFGTTINATAQAAGVRQAQVTNATASTTTAPPTAADAPSKGSNNIFTGLCDALNQYQQDLVKKGTYEVADQYEINFAPPTIGASQVVKPGPVAYKNTAGKSTKTAQDKVDANTDAVNVNSQTWQVLAGTQIVQFIDQVMRSSTYITGQQKVNFTEDGKQTQNKSAGASGVTAWYKISLSAKQLAYDNKRRDHAYKMTFTISPYAINQMASPYFPDSNYRGAHKDYNYWFTGLNTQILSYEQEYNQAYYVTLSGNPEALATAPPTGRDQFKQTHMATSEQRGQGQANYVNEPADNAASFLYSVSDFSEVKMSIVGDPAWMQQGEAAFGVSPQTFSFNPFNSDGGINYDSQEVVFTVSFNRPTDYNFNTGIMNTNSATGTPQEKFSYIAKSCKNVFSKGKFTQELVGSLLPLTNSTNGSSIDAGRPSVSSESTNTRNLLTSGDADAQEGGFYGNTNTAPPSSETGETSGYGEQHDVYDPATTGTPTPQLSPPPASPTSSGDINSADVAPIGSAGVNSQPQLIARDD